MLKQSDAVIIFVVIAAAIGVVVMTSGTASLVIIAVLAMVFGGLVGARLHSGNTMASQSADGDEHEDLHDNEASPTTAPTAAAPAEAASAAVPGTDAIAAAATQPKTAAASAHDARSAERAGHLEQLMATLPEGLTLKDTNGRYQSVNDAFARMVGQRPAEIVGRDDAAIFGHLTAQSLLASDDAAAAHGRISVTMEIPLSDGPRFFEISKASINGDDDRVDGIAAVWHDVTDVARNRTQRDKAMRETIMAFTKSIELRDHYLGDHAQRLAQLSAAVADAMNLDDDIATTVELAGYLSQIGKLGIGSDLLSVERRFTESEIKEMQKHVHFTARLLRDMDFGLPVSDALYQMNERLDGSGYPQGLQARDIALPARILGACDVFCARTAERSYRPAIEPEAALDILRQNPHRYDEAVVRALYQVVKPAARERLSA